MGKCETITTSIGISITISLLLEQLNEQNFKLVKKLLNNGFIDNPEDIYNKSYCDITQNSDLPKSYEEYKEFLTAKFKEAVLEEDDLEEDDLEEDDLEEADLEEADLEKEDLEEWDLEKDDLEEEDLEDGCLFDSKLLVPFHKLLEINIWGYDTYGTNGSSCKLDFDLDSVKKKINNKLEEKLSGYAIVMILKQHSG